MPFHKIYSLLNELDDLYAIPFMMDYLGHEHKEIAKYLKVPVTTLHRRLQNARKLLKEKINAGIPMELV